MNFQESGAWMTFFSPAAAQGRRWSCSDADTSDACFGDVSATACAGSLNAKDASGTAPVLEPSQRNSSSSLHARPPPLPPVGRPSKDPDPFRGGQNLNFDLQTQPFETFDTMAGCWSFSRLATTCRTHRKIRPGWKKNRLCSTSRACIA